MRPGRWQAAHRPAEASRCRPPPALPAVQVLAAPARPRLWQGLLHPSHPRCCLAVFARPLELAGRESSAGQADQEAEGLEKTYDKKWECRFRELAEFKIIYGHCDVPSRFDDNPQLGQWVRTQRWENSQGKLCKGRAERLKLLGLKWRPRQKQRRGSSWEGRYGELEAFSSRHGHCYVPRSMSALAAWADLQRKHCREGKLSRSKICRLDSLGLDWDAPARHVTREERWNEQYEALRAYSASNGGSCDVPQRYPPSPSLGVWVHTQRRAHAAGRLSPERKARLDELGFVWGAEAPAADSAQRRFEGSLDPGDGGQRMLTPRESPPVRTLDGCEWELNFQDLLRFKSKHGHCRVPDRDRKWPRLALWAADQRRLHSQGLLQPTRVARLSGAGFQLCGSSELEWARMLERLEKVLAMHGGDCGLHTLAAEDEGLGRWLQQQRRALRRRMLPEDRAAQLRSLGPDLLGEGCEVESYGAIWEQQYAELEGHLRCHGHGLSTMPPRLQAWVMAQRKSRKNSTLAEQRVRLLDELGFEWLPTWETQFEELLAYRHRHGDCLVPQSYRCNPQLGIWVRTQRRSHRHGSMLATRAKRLDALGFHWGSNPCEDSQHWEARFCELQEKAAGSPRWLPEEGNPLARWLEAQAHEHQMGRLSEDRCRRLGFLLGAAWSGGWAQPYSSSVELSWQEGLRLVDERIEREGGIHSVSRDPSLVAWISNQRQLHSKGGLSDGPVRRLRDLGLLREGSDAMAGDLPDAPAQESGVSAVPLSPANSEWWRFHQLLAAFQEKHGHCNVPGAANPRLAAWVARQRTLAASGALRPDRAAALGGLGFSWREDSPLRPAAEVWETRFQELVDFRLQHGHCRVPRADRVLGEWVVMQRYLRRRGSLAAEYVSRLDHAGFDWSEGSEGQGTANLRRTAPQPCDRDASRCWELHFQELLDYHVEHGHCRVPEDDPELAPLAGWVRLQVYRCEVGSAPEDQMRQLRSLGLELNNRWSERLAELTAYMRENGDCSMPAGGKYRHLHRWAEEQREAMRNNRLEAEKVRQLDKLGFCWE